MAAKKSLPQEQTLSVMETMAMESRTYFTHIKVNISEAFVTSKLNIVLELCLLKLPCLYL